MNRHTSVIGWGREAGVSGPRGGARRSFDPRVVGSLECDAWVAYYRRDWLTLVRCALTLSRSVFGLSWLATIACSWLALRATRLWAPYPDNDPDGARRAMRRYYNIVGRGFAQTFDPATAAALELDWWRVHRENQHSDAAGGEPALVEALAQLYSHLYGLAPGALRGAAEHRAAAMRHSDRWIREGCHLDSPLIEREREALICSYTSLMTALPANRLVARTQRHGPAARVVSAC